MVMSTVCYLRLEESRCQPGCISNDISQLLGVSPTSHPTCGRFWGQVNPKSKELATLCIDFGGRDMSFLVPKMEVPS